MAFIKSKKLYAILMSDEDGKKIVRNAPQMSDKELENELNGFFKKSGKSVDESVDTPREPLILYHQTSAKSLSDFDESKRKAGLSDIETPKGIFLKETAEDIGLSGKNQLKLSTKLEHPLEVDNREDLISIFKATTGLDVKKIENEIDAKYESKNDEYEEMAESLYKKAYYEKDIQKKREYEDELKKVMEEQKNHVQRWVDAGKEVAQTVQEQMTKAFKELGYDGVIMKNDVGSMGRKVKTYIVFDKSQLIELNDETLPKAEQQRLRNL